MDQIFLDIDSALNAEQSTSEIPATDLMDILSNLSQPINSPPISTMPATSTTATNTDQIFKLNLGTADPCPLLLAQSGVHGNIVDWVNTDIASSTVTSNAMPSRSARIPSLNAPQDQNIFSRFESQYVPTSSSEPIATVSAASLHNSNAIPLMGVNYPTTSPTQLTMLQLPARRVSIASIAPMHHANNQNQQQVQRFSPCGCACMNCGSQNVWKEPTLPLSYPVFPPSFPPALPPLQTFPQQPMPMISPFYYGNNTANFYPYNDALTQYSTVPYRNITNGNSQLVYENTDNNPQLMGSSRSSTHSVSRDAFAQPFSSQPHRGDYACNDQSARWNLPPPHTFNN